MIAGTSRGRSSARPTTFGDIHRAAAADFDEKHFGIKIVGYLRECPGCGFKNHAGWSICLRCSIPFNLREPDQREFREAMDAMQVWDANRLAQTMAGAAQGSTGPESIEAQERRRAQQYYPHSSPTARTWRDTAAAGIRANPA
jgi:hypothetical protein